MPFLLIIIDVFLKPNSSNKFYVKNIVNPCSSATTSGYVAFRNHISHTHTHTPSSTPNQVQNKYYLVNCCFHAAGATFNSYKFYNRTTQKCLVILMIYGSLLLFFIYDVMSFRRINFLGFVRSKNTTFPKHILRKCYLNFYSTKLTKINDHKNDQKWNSIVLHDCLIIVM